jgi:eukaryotic-like serine/threonine-protein kinase
MSQLSGYTLLERIGTSILGAVYKAQDAVTSKLVALKVLQLGLLDDVSSCEMDARLQREFEAAVRLVHPGIARVYEIRRDGKTALVASELVDGPSITAYARQAGGGDLSLVVTATVQMLEALEFAHNQGVIHRDLKPSNVLVSEGARIKITDFGMADLGTRNRKDTGMLVGETQYMAPEQFLSAHKVDKRCDIHAVGTILYELLTGISPFAPEKVYSFAAMTKVLKDVPPPPSKAKPGLPVVFDRVVGRALAKSPAERFASAKQFRDELCAAYFSLTRQQPRLTLPPLPPPQAAADASSAVPEPPASAPAAPHTTYVQTRPISWSVRSTPGEGAPLQPAAARRVDASTPEPPVRAAEAAAVSKVAGTEPTSGDRPLERTRHIRMAPAGTSPLEPAELILESAGPGLGVAPVEAPRNAPAPAAGNLASQPEVVAAAAQLPTMATPSAAPIGADPAAVASKRQIAPSAAAPAPTPPRAAARNAKRPNPLTDASIAHGGRVLARFVGPIAIVLSKRAAQDAHDERAYFELLAAHLSDPDERSQFFRALRQRSS